MSYQEKRTIASIVVGALILVAYCAYALSVYKSDAAGSVAFWAGAMLIFIGIGAAAVIVVQIIFHILLAASIAVKEKSNEQKLKNKIAASFVEDEMDKLIELKASRLAFTIAGFGFVAGLVLLVLDFSPAVMLNILFLSCLIGSLFEGFLNLHYYRKGVRNG
jgi:hypothetical protein